MEIEIPYEFEQFVKRFHPGSRLEVSGHQEWIEQNLSFVDERARSVIRQFLDVLLSARHTDAEIAEVWRRQSPSYDFSDGGHRFFLMEVRELLG